MITMQQLIEECEKGHNYRAAHEHQTCPVPVDGAFGVGPPCGAKVVNRYFVNIGSDVP
jgi:hypothetical protein